MKATIHLEWLRDRISAKFMKISDCKVEFKETYILYKLLNNFSDGYSYIEFHKDRLTRPIIVVSFKDLYYFRRAELPSGNIVKRFLLDARIAETCKDYLSIYEELMTYPFLREYATETLHNVKHLKIRYELRRSVYYSGDVVLDCRLFLNDTYDDFIRMYRITSSEEQNKLIITAYYSIYRLKYKTIKLKIAPDVHESIESYMLKIYDLQEFWRLLTALKELIKLVKLKKYKVKDAISELLEMYGYHDIFGYQI